MTAQPVTAQPVTAQRVTTSRPGRSPDVEPFLAGCAWRAVAGVPYPRFDPRDASRIPADTWLCAQIPAGVRLELVGDASAITLDYVTATDDLGYRGPGAGTTFALWRAGEQVDEQPALLGAGTVTLSLGSARGQVPAVVYLPEGMRPEVLAIRAVGGSIEPAPRGPRWVAYGDSLLEGWVASAPALAWGALAARRHGLDLVNLGYAGSARGEIPCAEAVAGLPADVISISHGTNCWTRTPHSAGMMLETTRAFLDIVRQGHPDTPMVVASPVLRPDAETTPNRLGATLADLRAAMEEVVQARIDAGDDALVLIPGAAVITAEHLADGIHPGDEGQARLAEVFGAAIAAAVRPGAAGHPGHGD
ncbi:MAG TPA: SGNH/GDSL hydrolase family protein [Acidimicrobiales bacterium]|nr:SGNH/GDSL hydrolase family protein [Acidimicrobiales bacterium]